MSAAEEAVAEGVKPMRSRRLVPILVAFVLPRGARHSPVWVAMMRSPPMPLSPWTWP